MEIYAMWHSILMEMTASTPQSSSPFPPSVFIFDLNNHSAMQRTNWLSREHIPLFGESVASTPSYNMLWECSGTLIFELPGTLHLLPRSC